MKMICYGGPFEGKELIVNRHLPVYDLPYPFISYLSPSTIETYRQYYRDIYQWVASRPYHPPNLQVKEDK